jgi:Domain of unknown function (DUF3854)/Family of unknown function (DUF5906)
VPSPSVVIELPRALALKDLARSGLRERDFKRLRLEALTSEEVFQLTAGRFKSRAIKFPYLTPGGRVTGYFRLRFLDSVRGFGARKVIKYWQPADSEIRIYFSPGIEWLKLLADPTAELWVTEGEKKAAAACAAGLPVLGLGGVWNWRSTKNRQPLIPDLLAINWKARRVKLCFDTEADPNPLVSGALEALGHALELRGALVGVVALPLLNEEAKTGLDDFLLARSVKDLLALEAVTLASGAELIKLNEELVVIESLASILHLPSRRLFTSSRPLIDVLYPHRRVPGMDSAGRLTELPAVTEWLRWPRHRVARGISFEPGEPPLLEDGRVNMWTGWPFAPRKGSVKLLTDLLDYQFANAEPEHKRWFTQWLAYPLQHPGAKLYTSVVLWSRDTGTGKSLIGHTLGRVYGSSFGVVTEAQLHSGFNSWQADKQFILGEEVSGSDKRGEADRLKFIVTGEIVTVNAKHQPEYETRNVANFLFTSNHHDAFSLEARDRRQFVHEVGVGAPKPPVEWFTTTYDAWYKSDAGAAAVFHYLLNVDLTGFDPRAPAPQTAARAEMISASGSETDYLIRELLEAPDAYLKLGDTAIPRSLFTVRELIALLDPEGRGHLSQIGVAKALRRAGSVGPLMTRTARGPVKLFAVRDLTRWATASHAARAADYNGADAEAPPRKEKF